VYAGNAVQPLPVEVAVSRAVLTYLAAVSLLTVAACGGSDQQEPGNPGGAVIKTTQADPNGLRGATLDTPYAMPRTSLTDTGGNEFNLVTSTTKPVTLVFFGYTHCPDVCNTVLADIASALTKLDDQTRAEIQMVFITTDPARDDGPVIRKYLDRFDPTFTGLTGRLPVIKSVAQALGVPVEGMQKLPSGGYEVGHGAQVIGFGKDDKAGVLWLSNAAIGDLAHDFQKLVERNR
jgi:protein SCO1